MICALILAAGQSKRMGRPKMSLPWGASTILGHVIEVFRLAGAEEVLVVTGGDKASVEQIAEAWQARTVFNPEHASGEMLSSLQVGLQAMPAAVEAAMIALGDQPQIQESTVRSILEVRAETRMPLIVPSYLMRRGHPWLVARPLWGDILAMHSPQTVHDFLVAHAADITYVDIDTPTVLEDLDTPDDYGRYQGQ